jgi:CrcB protein
VVRGHYGDGVTSHDLTTVAWVAGGGVVGALSRYGLESAWAWQAPGFPWATWVVNVVGCLAIGTVLVVLLEGPVTVWWLRPFLAVGVLGGFTTFSALAVESVVLLDEGAAGLAGGYVLASLVGGLIAVWISATMTRRYVMRRGSA